MSSQPSLPSNSRDGGASAQRVPAGILDDWELVGVRLPDVLSTIVVLGCHNYFVRDEEGRVEAHAKLAN